MSQRPAHPETDGSSHPIMDAIIPSVSELRAELHVSPTRKKGKDMQAAASRTRASRSIGLPLIGPLTLLVTMALGGCDDFPNDIAGTMDEVMDTGVLHAGLVAGPAEADEQALAEKVAGAAGANPEIQSGSAEVLLHQLEDGELDLVVGEFAKASPWKKRVAFTRTPEQDAQPPKHQPVLRAAVRNGENRWLMFVSKTIGEEA